MIGNILSKLEIKLIQKSRRFVTDLNEKEIYENNSPREFLLSFNERTKRNESDLCISTLGGKGYSKVTWLIYSNNAEKGELVFGSPDIFKGIMEDYKNFLIQEIPEIKDRIKTY